MKNTFFVLILISVISCSQSKLIIAEFEPRGHKCISEEKYFHNDYILNYSRIENSTLRGDVHKFKWGKNDNSIHKAQKKFHVTGDGDMHLYESFERYIALRQGCGQTCYYYAFLFFDGSYFFHEDVIYNDNKLIIYLKQESPIIISIWDIERKNKKDVFIDYEGGTIFTECLKEICLTNGYAYITFGALNIYSNETITYKVKI